MKIDKTVIELARTLWDYHYLKQEVKPADLIFGLGSLDIRTADRAAELYLAGYAPKILFSGGIGHHEDLLDTGWNKSEAEMFAARAQELGVPSSAILIEPKATNTGENVTLGYNLLQENGLNPESIILVQKPHMLRRTYATFMKQWPGANMSISVTSPELSFEEYVLGEPEVEQVRLINVIVGYTERIKLYAEKGFQIPQEMPNKVWAAYEELLALGFNQKLQG